MTHTAPGFTILFREFQTGELVTLFDEGLCWVHLLHLYWALQTYTELYTDLHWAL